MSNVFTIISHFTIKDNLTASYFKTVFKNKFNNPPPGGTVSVELDSSSGISPHSAGHFTTAHFKIFKTKLNITNIIITL